MPGTVYTSTRPITRLRLDKQFSLLEQKALHMPFIFPVEDLIHISSEEDFYFHPELLYQILSKQITIQARYRSTKVGDRLYHVPVKWAKGKGKDKSKRKVQQQALLRELDQRRFWNSSENWQGEFIRHFKEKCRKADCKDELANVRPGESPAETVERFSVRQILIDRRTLKGSKYDKLPREFAKWLNNEQYLNWQRQEIYIWLGTGGGSTCQPHTDPSDNLLLQSMGSKSFFIFPPSELRRMYACGEQNYFKKNKDDCTPHNSLATVSELDLSSLTSDVIASKYPLLREAQGVHGEIQRGEVLYIPRHFMHHVASHGEPNLAINTWFSWSVDGIRNLSLAQLVTEIEKKEHAQVNRNGGMDSEL
eukprot:gnl/MRDRNA2_/MRDRNA2_158858_c0_seq1.p1 gnl/MRDRNA2_/MRDRNA2_158858_c0~~gnl/MRDRNA2_/MRDRNA2_158858_c0_seq1.p1  ORF type:complete len:409 (-),score=43.90 gnl/MRDRNA2_/MRDRNA2_158858_c0_seq1:136-1227(-)